MSESHGTVGQTVEERNEALRQRAMSGIHPTHKNVRNKPSSWFAPNCEDCGAGGEALSAPCPKAQAVEAEPHGWQLVPVDDLTREVADSALPYEMINAGEEVFEQVAKDNANYVAGETTDWDHGMIAVAVYRAMLAAAPPTEASELLERMEGWRPIATAPKMDACFCIGPQNGQPLCPCRMRCVEVQDGRYVLVTDLGPVTAGGDTSLLHFTAYLQDDTPPPDLRTLTKPRRVRKHPFPKKASHETE